MIKNGSWVKVKSYNEIKGHYDFVDGMKSYCGLCLQIEELKDEDDDDNSFSITEKSKLKENDDYWFYESMLEELSYNHLNEGVTG